MKKLFLVFSLLFICFVTLGCTQNELGDLEIYLDESSSYDIASSYDDGIFKINVPMVEVREDFVLHETFLLILAIKSYPREKLNLFDEVNLHFFEKDTDKTVAEVQVKGNKLMETDWKRLRSFTDIPDNVNNYDYKWEHK